MIWDKFFLVLSQADGESRVQHQRYSKGIGLCSRKPDVVSLYGDIDPKSRAMRVEVHGETVHRDS